MGQFQRLLPQLAATTSEQFLAAWLLSTAEMASGGRWCRSPKGAAGKLRHRKRAHPAHHPRLLRAGDAVGGAAHLATHGGRPITLLIWAVKIPPGAYARLCRVPAGAKDAGERGNHGERGLRALVPMDGYRHVEQVGYNVPSGGR